MTDNPANPAFHAIRPRLVRLAYRMLGSVTDAEEIVQDAYLRWLQIDQDTVRQPQALLYTIVTRLCLNELKSARRNRETYIGPWVPEPIVDDTQVDVADDITLSLMIVLERLSPLERAAFLLHDVFGLTFDDVAGIINREAATCRKLASRARHHIHAERPRFPVSKEQGTAIAAAFFAASRNGDMHQLQSLLADDVTAVSDGGGKVLASPQPLMGINAVMERHLQLAHAFSRSPSRLIRYAIINGLPGFITVEDENILQTTALQIAQEKITAIYVVRNPDKLRHLGNLFIQ